MADWEQVKSSDEQSQVKCIEVVDNVNQGWCSQQCNTKIDGACPTQLCLCDWDGEWPSDDDDFSDWDLGSLGIKSGNTNGGGGLGGGHSAAHRGGERPPLAPLLPTLLPSLLFE